MGKVRYIFISVPFVKRQMFVSYTSTGVFYNQIPLIPHFLGENFHKISAILVKASPGASITLVKIKLIRLFGIGPLVPSLFQPTGSRLRAGLQTLVVSELWGNILNTTKLAFLRPFSLVHMGILTMAVWCK